MLIIEKYLKKIIFKVKLFTEIKKSNRMLFFISNLIK